jgi:hypothetical protein
VLDQVSHVDGAWWLHVGYYGRYVDRMFRL